MRKPRTGRRSVLKLVQRKGSPYWHISGTVNGKRYRESTGCIEYARADEVRVKWEQRLHDIRIYGEEAVVTFAEAVTEYVQAGHDKRFLERLLDYFEVTPCIQITPRMARAAAMNLYPKASKSTWNRQVITPLSAVVNFALADSGQEKRRFPRFPEPTGRLLWATPEQAEIFLRECAAEKPGHAAGDLPIMATVLFGTGMRRTEILSAAVRDWHPRSEQIFVPYEKAGQGRMVPYPSRVTAALSSLPERNGDMWRTPRGKNYGERAKDPKKSWRWQAWSAAASRADMNWLTPHIARHTFATWFCAQTKDLLRCQQIGSWARLQTLQRYAKVAPADLGERLLEHGWDFRPLSDSLMSQNWRDDTTQQGYRIVK